MSHQRTTDPDVLKQGWMLCGEASPLVGKSVQTLYRWIDQKQVSGLRDGYRRYIKWNELLDHLGDDYCKLKKLKRV